MLTSLPLLLVCAAALPPGAPSIDGARAELTADGLGLDVLVTTSSPVRRSDLRAKLRPHLLSVYVDGTRVPLDGAALGTETRPIVVRERPRYAKLEIALPEGARCREPVALDVDERGVHAHVTCGPIASPSAADTRAAASPPPRKLAPVSLPAAVRAPAAVVAPAAVAAPAAAAPVVTPAAAAPVVVAAPATVVLPAAETAPDRPQPPTGNPKTTIVSLLLLCAAGVGLLVWSRRRRLRLGGRIRILETATLGPKRTLILAEINGATLVIGSSEAGISLLSTTATASAPEVSPDRPAPQGEEATDDQGGVLSRLFGPRRLDDLSTDPKTGNPEEDDVFAAMLRESLDEHHGPKAQGAASRTSS